MTYQPNELHGKVIQYEQMKNMPVRNAFLEKDIYNEVDHKISVGKPLLFMPNDLSEMHLQDKKYEKSQYKIVLFGVLIDGRKATVVINGIKPYFEVVIPPSENESADAMDLYKKLQQEKYATPDKCEIIKGRQFKEYQKNKLTFARFYFTKLKVRKEAIKYVRDMGYETSTDDASCYYRVVCRDNLTSFSSWIVISEYEIRTYSSIRKSVFEVNIRNYKLCTDDITKNIRLAKDNTMTACWDIETYSPDGQVPLPAFPDHRMFMIGVTFQWHHANDQLLRVCLVEHPCDPRPNYLTIVCGSEKKLIKAFGKLSLKMKPEIFLGFNDSDYDWPWLIKRAKEYTGVLSFLGQCFDNTKHWANYDDENIFKYNYKKESVKLEADAYADGWTLIYPGYINIDVRTIFRQLYPTAEKSNLNFYLDKNKLLGKKDMPYKELFRIYRELDKSIKIRENLMHHFKKFKFDNSITNIILGYDSNYIDLKDKMADVADYCVVDSQRCHELMKIRSVIMDRREVSKLSYTSVFDSLYRANGMKVRNLVIARGQKYGIKFTNISKYVDPEDKGKYPGAYVFPPKKGLITSKVSIQERIENSGLIPNYSEWSDVDSNILLEYYRIIEKYNSHCSDEIINEIIKDRELNNQIPLKKCFIDFLKENTGRPITGLDFSSLYPSLIMTYNFSPEYIITKKATAIQAIADGHKLHKIKFPFAGRTIRGWSILHDNKIDPSSTDYKFGIYPSILKELFDARKLLKKDLHKWEAEKERLENLSREEFTTSVIKEEYDIVCFNFNYADSKQKALKVFMNTFYGEAGNKRSPFFVIQIAGGITTAGQENIKMVQHHVEENGCNVHYGDSVTGDTPLVLRDSDTGIVYIKTIDDIASVESWISYNQFKPGEPDRIQKQQAPCNLQIWTDGEWHDINRVIRHKTNKKMFRVNTHIGCIDVTEDHSLLTNNRLPIKPNDVEIGTELLHSFPTEFPEIINDNTQIDHNMNSVSTIEAYVWGFFMVDGSCSTYNASSSTKSSWVINNQNIRYLTQLLENLAICEPNLKFKLLDMNNSGVYKLVPTGHVNLIVEKYRTLFYDKRKFKIVPTKILNGSLEVRQSFYDGYYYGDGYKTYEHNSGRDDFYCKGKITSQCMYYLVKSLGRKYVSIYTSDDKSDIYRISSTNSKFRKNPIAIKKILKLPVTNETFVYDIETSKGSFLGGVGEINLKNTDSIYSAMPEKHFLEIDKKYYTGKLDKEEYWKTMVNITFTLIEKLNNDVNIMLRNDNGTEFLKMAFEESLFPVAFLAKKKYYGIPHISIPNFHPKNLFIRGLEVKKRGVSDVLKKVCLNIMWNSISLTNIHSLMDLVNNKIDEIYTIKWEFNDFIMTDVFRPNKQNVKIHTFAKRMLDIGKKLEPHNRFKYVIVKKNPFKYDNRGRKKELMIGEKMEFAEYAEEQNMSIDLDYYMKGSINGQLARLITYKDIFHTEPESVDLDDLKVAEAKTYNNACKYIENYCGKYYTTYNSKGKIYQKVFRISNSMITEKIKTVYSKEVVEILNSNYDTEDFEGWLENKSEKVVEKGIKDYGKNYICSKLTNLNTKDKNAKIKELQNIYFANKNNNLLRNREDAFRDRQRLLRHDVKNNINIIINILNHHQKMVGNISKKIKDVLDIDAMYNNAGDEVPIFENLPNINNIDSSEMNKIADDEIIKITNNVTLNASINKLKFIYINMISNYDFIHKTRAIATYLKTCRDKTIRTTAAPPSFNYKQRVLDDVQGMIHEINSDK